MPCEFTSRTIAARKDDAIEDAMADRDAIDDDPDDAAQTARNSLAGRGKTADREEPYTLIYPDGIGYYTAAPLDENTQRYGQLKRRLEAKLPAADPLRRPAVPALTRGIKDFDAACKTLYAAQPEEHIAGTRAKSALRAMERQFDKTYGALVADIGRAAAERCFPKTRGTRSEVEAPTKPAPTPT